MWKDEGPPRSSRLMSSKWVRSLWPMTSDIFEEWKDEDLDDFEFVRSGGLPGAAIVASAAYVRVAMSGRGALGGRSRRKGVPMRLEEVIWMRSGDAFTRWAADGINERTYSCSDIIYRDLG